MGISNSASNFGTHLITTPLGTVDWQQYSVVFNTANAEQHLTIEVGVGDTNNYVLYIDNFVIEETNEPITTWHCLNNSCIDTADGSGVYTSFSDCAAICGVSSINEVPLEKQLLKIVDILGRESKPKKNTALFYIYSDGTVEKRIVIE